ncbi:COG4315 family predicted lipoprotein [Hahella ganghwensis]|uniref:COG4315 family predicted lipoprotein n=1 Tax=Hahella ganghwensis TaxID=286420 RepID=UPI00036BC591|nr:hypothetical protein [Hahella ganghwensis]
MKLTTLTTIATLTIATLGATNAFAEGKADTVDYFAKDKHQKSTYSSGYQSNGDYQSSGDYQSGSNENNATTGRVVTKVNTSIGTVFANAQGMTLYTFTKDTADASNCYDGCTGSWPPFFAKADAKVWGEFSVIQRKDGTYQWAYKNQPLYTWVGDRQQGDTSGDGVGSVWYAAKP